MPGNGSSGPEKEMPVWLLSRPPLTRMNSGVPPLLLFTCLAAMWSRDGPIGSALNFAAVLLRSNGLSVFGVTGWHVKYEPTTWVCGSLPCPTAVDAFLLLACHWFMARM